MSCNSKSPGAADYKLKPLIGFKDHDFNSLKSRAPEWTMGGRTKSLKNSKTPGPVDVGPNNRYGKYPTIGGVMLRRHKDLKSGAHPGPANYNSTPLTLYRWPYDAKYSMGLRTKSKNLSVGPGPVIEATPVDVYKNRAPKYPLFSRIKDFKDGKSPGPSDYNKAGDDKLRTLTKPPAYSMRSRGVKTGKARGPGPADYDLKNYNPFDRSPTYHIGSKPKKPGCVGVYILPQDNC